MPERHQIKACGIDFFDTADVYGSGSSETLIGKFLKEFGIIEKNSKIIRNSKIQNSTL